MPPSVILIMRVPPGPLTLAVSSAPAGQCVAGELESADLVTVVLGQDARLPCFYRGDPNEQVAQVAWARRDGSEGPRELALLHAQYGLHVSPGYEGRVEQPPLPRNPLDGAVLLRNAVQADEGEYECRVSTFPAGSFQARLQLRVLGKPAACAETQGRLRGCGVAEGAQGRAGVRGGVAEVEGASQPILPPQSPGDPSDLSQLGQPWGRIPSLLAGLPPADLKSSPLVSSNLWGNTTQLILSPVPALSASCTSPPLPLIPRLQPHLDAFPGPCPTPSQLRLEALPLAWTQGDCPAAHISKSRDPSLVAQLVKALSLMHQGCGFHLRLGHTQESLSQKKKKKKKQKTLLLLLPHPTLLSKLNLLVSTTFKDTLSKPPSSGRAGPDMTR